MARALLLASFMPATWTTVDGAVTMPHGTVSHETRGRHSYLRRLSCRSGLSPTRVVVRLCLGCTSCITEGSSPFSYYFFSDIGGGWWRVEARPETLHSGYRSSHRRIMDYHPPLVGTLLASVASVQRCPRATLYAPCLSRHNPPPTYP